MKSAMVEREAGDAAAERSLLQVGLSAPVDCSGVGGVWVGDVVAEQLPTCRGRCCTPHPCSPCTPAPAFGPHPQEGIRRFPYFWKLHIMLGQLEERLGAVPAGHWAWEMRRSWPGCRWVGPTATPGMSTCAILLPLLCNCAAAPSRCRQPHTPPLCALRSCRQHRRSAAGIRRRHQALPRCRAALGGGGAAGGGRRQCCQGPRAAGAGEWGKRVPLCLASAAKGCLAAGKTGAHVLTALWSAPSNHAGAAEEPQEPGAVAGGGAHGDAGAEHQGGRGAHGQGAAGGLLSTVTGMDV